ncbi:transcriptional regulator ATRX homolog [Eurosta solidaginis]|uniref:transcriptional regulator ATRX homolog n=1 Tax=Eurosta solidaginis TaxID=178769 RepID=UPI0035306051
MSKLLTSADIEDGKVIVDPVTKERTEYKVIDGGYEVKTISPQPNGTVKTSVRTFWDPKPVSEEDARREAQNKLEVRKRFGKTIRIDKKTTMLTREIEGGYEEVYTTTNDDGTQSSKTKTFFDSVPEDQLDKLQKLAADRDTINSANTTNTNKNKKTLVKKSSVDSTDSQESRRLVQRTDQSNFQQHTTVEESRRVMESSEVTENNRTVRKNSVQEQNIRHVTSSSGGVDSKDKLKKKKTKSNIPPPPPDFIENETTTVTSKRVPHGVEYTYSTKLESGSTITTSKTVYEEEETELTEEEIQQYKKTLKDAEKHKNVTTTKKLRSESGTKKIVPSENPGEVTTVETIRIEGGTEYHYTTVTAEGIVKKAVKTVYDPVQGVEENEEEIVEEYEEEIIEPGEKNVRTIESVKKLPQKFEESVTVTEKTEKTEKKVKKSMMIRN